jgi:glutamate dehydrogenase
MSGDVFGNAMLLSRAIRLVAAFDHRHIFLDPDPADLEAALAERQRLFDLPRSSWADYDRRLISEGGGVYARTEKSIPLSPAVRALTGLTADSVTPVELMHALLGAPCDLMWFGGIGTYVKAAAETHAEVGDRANDAIRVDAERLRARVVGEGANLGMTQRARIAAARTGVRLNTDAVDNSAGVDTSDHEVNLKILLADALRAGALAPVERDPLLRAMTDEVAAHVLAHNYAQTRALTLASATAVEDLDAHGRMIARLEAAGKLDRGVETLPSNDALRAMRDAGQGLTRPELSRLVAYAKLDLKDELVSGDAIDDPHFITHLETYFPHQVAVFAAHMRQHRLRREIVATVVANDVVDLGGPTFVYRAQESADVDAQAIVRAFEAARHIFRFPELIGQIDALDLVAPASVQTELMLEVIALLRRQTYWLARRARTAGPRPIGDVIAGYRGGVDILRAQVVDLISPFERARGTERMRRFTEAGAPRELARDAASLRALVSATDIVDLASEAGWPLEPAARVYFAVGDRLGIERLRAASGSVSSDQHYDRLAVRRIVEDLYQVQADATASVIAGLARPADRDGAPDAAQARTVVDVWLEEKGSDAARIDTLLGELEGAGPWTFAKLTIAAAFIRENARLAC